jgi:hypothetical protein
MRRTRGVGSALTVIALCALAAGCAEFIEDVREVRELVRKLRGRDPAPPPPAPPVVTAPGPGLTLRGGCKLRDETGYAEAVTLEVANGRVVAFDARIDVPKRGGCRYQLAEFRQTKEAPTVELLARSGSACAVRMWQQHDRVTVVATDCDEKCARGAFEYVWPIQLRADGGGCY